MSIAEANEKNITVYSVEPHEKYKGNVFSDFTIGLEITKKKSASPHIHIHSVWRTKVSTEGKQALKRAEGAEDS